MKALHIIVNKTHPLFQYISENYVNIAFEENLLHALTFSLILAIILFFFIKHVKRALNYFGKMT